MHNAANLLQPNPEDQPMKYLALIASLFISLSISSAFAGDLQEIKSRGELRHLGVAYANFVTGSGDGFDVELMQGFAKEIGVKYVFVQSDFYSIIRDLLGKDVVRKDGKTLLENEHPVKGDVISTGFTKLPWREEIVIYSEPTFPSQVLLVARADAPQAPIKGSDNLAKDIAETKALIGTKSLLVLEKTCLDPNNYGLKNIGIDLKSYAKSTNLNEMVPALINGDADFTLLDVPDVILDLQRWTGKIKVLGPISEEQVLATAFPKSSLETRDAFNAYLSKIKANGTYDRLVDKYYPGIRSYFPSFFAHKG
jgi:ABC-type amino acid transport substrate-binding protein